MGIVGMESFESILSHYNFTDQDEAHLKELASILLPVKDDFAEAFYGYILENEDTARFFYTQEAVEQRKETIKGWLTDILSSPYDHRLLNKLQRIGMSHVRIGLEGHWVNASMSFVRRYFQEYLVRTVSDPIFRDALLETLDKVLDVSLDVMTSSYREAEIKKVFLSQRIELWLVKWSERLLHGLNLILMIGLAFMAVGVAGLLATDIFYALSASLERGVIKALGSLLILWMMIELLHTQVRQLRGGKFHVRIFVDLALVAFIRKIFVASIEEKDAITYGLLLGALLVLGLLYFLLGRADPRK
jgi:uncharacterized membrane protein (DUF373 family)